MSGLSGYPTWRLVDLIVRGRFAIIVAGVLGIGALTQVAQVAVHRTILQVSTPIELILGVTLSTWLLSGALGAQVAVRFAGLPRHRSKILFLCLGMTLISIHLVLILGPWARWCLGVGSGVVLDPLRAAIIAVVLTFVPGFFSGALFCMALATWGRGHAADAAGLDPVWIFAIESMGAAIAGPALAGSLLARWTPGEVLGLASLLPFCAVASWPGNRGGVVRGVLVLVCLVFISNAGIRLNLDSTRSSIARDHVGFAIDSVIQSNEGSMALLRSGSQTDLLHDGQLVWSTPQSWSEESLVAFVANQPSSLNRVALSGIGLAGLIGPLTNLGCRSIDLFESSDILREVSLEWNPHLALRTGADPVRIRENDLREFIRRAPDTYDLVVVQGHSPTTICAMRLYTTEFFKEVATRLNEGGVLAILLPSATSQGYAGAALVARNEPIVAALKSAFLVVVALPGETEILLASMSEGIIAHDPETLAHRLALLPGKLESFTPNLFETLDQPLAFRRLNETYATCRPGRAVTDDHPLSYLSSLSFEFMESGTRSRSAHGLRLVLFLFLIATLMSAIAPLKHRFSAAKVRAFVTRQAPLDDGFIRIREPGSDRIMVAMFTVSAGGMGMIVAMMMGFQIRHGLLNRDLALILSSSMFGTAFGALWRRRMRPADAGRDLVAAGFSLALLGFVLASMGPASLDFSSWNRFGYAVVCGFISGFVGWSYAAATRHLGSDSAGLIYAADLAGASLGSLLTATILVPLLGLSFSVLTLTLGILAGLPKNRGPFSQSSPVADGASRPQD